MDSLTMTPFGKEMRDKHFLFGKEQVNLNQGAYGSYPRHVRDALRHWQDVAESEPDKFIRYTFPKKLDEIRHQVASFLNADVEGTVLVPNATTGLNTVLRNLRFESGDKIVYFRGVYGAIGKTVDYLIETTLVTSLEVDFDPAQDTEESILERFTSSIRGHGDKVKVAIFDTAMSMPGVRMPFEQLTKICRQHGIFSVIDGAHGIGFIDLDLKELDPDFLVTNCHKWLFIPRACAVFYVAPRNQHLMRSSLPTSHGFVPLGVSKHFNPNQSNAQNAFVAQFEYTGTIDTAPILCIPAALEFRSRVCGGEAAIREYCVDLARTGGRAVAEILGTETLPVPTGKHVGFANVRLPLTVQGHTTATEGIPAKDVNAVINFMFRKFTEDYHTFINVLYFSGALWARLCATVYLDVDDFKYGGMVLKKLCQRIESGEYLTQEARDI
ncbi:pyridoxal phosphate-dependent transferase [Fusarium solani]|uniref:Pyridoxal phosphate-dependent transferase n=1 Tax=Fusarium solani TaxID=169388 RepID=A0A9P9G6R8_FUSSL|nr:pyridoxal phosphate-dependent transferase [Fusarium solani]KAH7234049.1 pyridoxal phosphate-dependent transferase [Fusarium solani]